MCEDESSCQKVTEVLFTEREIDFEWNDDFLQNSHHSISAILPEFGKPLKTLIRYFGKVAIISISKSSSSSNITFEIDFQFKLHGAKSGMEDGALALCGFSTNLLIKRIENWHHSSIRWLTLKDALQSSQDI